MPPLSKGSPPLKNVKKPATFSVGLVGHTLVLKSFCILSRILPLSCSIISMRKCVLSGSWLPNENGGTHHIPKSWTAPLRGLSQECEQMIKVPHPSQCQADDQGSTPISALHILPPISSLWDSAHYSRSWSVGFANANNITCLKEEHSHKLTRVWFQLEKSSLIQ